MRVFIHGGMHKTGTTSFQGTLKLNRALLAGHGIDAPDLDALGLPMFRRGDRSAAAIAACRRLVDDAVRAGARTLVISHESVSTLSAGDMRHVVECFAPHDVTFVLCFRHWSSFLPSRWTQYCIRRDSQPFAEYLAMVADPGAPHVDLRFDVVLERAIAAAGRDRVVGVSYDAAVERDGSVVADLLRAVGIRDDLARRVLERVYHANVRGDWRTGELARLVNGVIADRRGLAQNALCRSIRDGVACDVFFDVGHRVRAMSADERLGAAFALLDRERRDATCTIPALEHATDALNAYHSHFVNTDGAAPFTHVHESTRTHVTTTNLTGSDLADAVPDAVACLTAP